MAPLPKLEVAGNSRVTLQDKGGNVFDVKAYGAKGDGATDDRVAIQNAINALPASGGTLYLPAGNYFISKDPSNPWSLNIVNKAVLVRGAGPDATIITITNPTAYGIRTDFNLGTVSDRELYMEIRDLKFVSSGTPSAGAAIFQESNTTPDGTLRFQNTFLVRNCWFLNVWDGIHLTNTGSAIIQGCQILNALHAAIVLENKKNEAVPDGDAGTTFICDNFIWDRVGTPPNGPGNHLPGQEIHGVLATSGSSGLRIHHNSFVNFDRPIYLNRTDVGSNTIIHIDHNSMDGVSKEAKIRVTNHGSIRRLDISSNDISIDLDSTIGVQVDVFGTAVGTGLTYAVIAGNTFNGGTLPAPATRKGIVLNPVSPSLVQKVVIADNLFVSLGTAIDIGDKCDRIYLGDNAFEEVTVPLTVASVPPLATRTLGAFFPDRLSVGKVNDLASRKELYVYSSAAIGPRLYLEGLAGTSSPGIDFAFDNVNSRRAGIVGAATGTSGVQLEFYTKPDGDTLKRRAVIDQNGRFQFRGLTTPAIVAGAIDFLFDAETTPRASIVATPGSGNAQLEFWTGGSLGGFAVRALLTPAGHFIPATDNAYTLGLSSVAGRWKDIFAIAKHSVLNTSFGSGVTLMPVLEGPEYLLYDSGSVTLGDSGEAFVELDPRFVEVTNTEMPYRVLTSGCKVKEREGKRFRIVGDPGERVDWMVMAVRAGFENVRFRDAEDAEPVGQEDPEHAVARKSPDNNKA